jgi:hypothetical protein
VHSSINGIGSHRSTCFFTVQRIGSGQSSRGTAPSGCARTGFLTGKTGINDRLAIRASNPEEYTEFNGFSRGTTIVPDTSRLRDFPPTPVV